MTNRIGRARAGGLLVGAMVMAAGTSASAANLIVSNGSGGGEAPCPGATFTTIQAAVNAAAPHDTVSVCAGTYAEQVTVPAGKDGLVLRLTQHLAAVIQAPSVMADPGDIVRINGAHNVTLEGFTVAGPLPNALFCSPLPRTGVRVDGGGSANIRYDHITEIRSEDPALRGCQNGIPILVGSQTEGQTGAATISRTTIDAYQKTGVLVDDVGSNAAILDNVVTGDGPNAMIAQNGIEIRNGADAVIAGNEVSGQVYSPSPLAAALLLYLPGRVSVIHNHVHAADYGVLTIDATRPEIASNTVTACIATGITLGQDTTGTTGAFVVANDSHDNGQDGVFVSGSSAGNTFFANRILANGGLDARDLSSGHGTASTADTWRRNFCKTDNHGGLLCDRESHANTDDAWR